MRAPGCEPVLGSLELDGTQRGSILTSGQESGRKLGAWRSDANLLRIEAGEGTPTSCGPLITAGLGCEVPSEDEIQRPTGQ
jgi:hypothetical protein